MTNPHFTASDLPRQPRHDPILMAKRLARSASADWAAARAAQDLYALIAASPLASTIVALEELERLERIAAEYQESGDDNAEQAATLWPDVATWATAADRCQEHLTRAGKG